MLQEGFGKDSEGFANYAGEQPKCFSTLRCTSGRRHDQSKEVDLKITNTGWLGQKTLEDKEAAKKNRPVKKTKNRRVKIFY